MKRWVYVDESSIHGKGLFALCDIPKGTILGVVKGVRTKQDGPYVLWLSADEGIRVRGNLRFINHSEKPNVAYYDSLEVIALRRIRRGEELTHNYAQ